MVSEVGIHLSRETGCRIIPMAFKPKLVDLDGLRVVLVKDDRQSVLVQAMVDAGSREETEEQAGAAHFLEHFVFKGTKKMPGVFDINERVEGVGGRFNAWTSHIDTGFWVKVAKEKIDLALEIVGQMVTEPILPDKYFEKERGTIIQEYYMYEDQPGAKASRTMWESLMGKTNMGRQVIGTTKSLKEMKIAYLKKFMKDWYRAENVVVGVVGNYGDEGELLKKIREEFAGLYGHTNKMPERDVFVWKEQKKPIIKLVSRKVDQARVSMGIPAIEATNRLRYAQYLTNIIFGSGTNSKLFVEVREKKGWAYSVGSGIDTFKEFGMVGVGGGFPKDKVGDAVKLIDEIMLGLGGNGKWAITKKELEIAKETYNGRISLRFDEPEKVLSMAMNDLLTEGKFYTPEEIKENGKKVTLDQVKEYCGEVFKLEKLNIGLVGDYESVPFKI